MKYFLDTEFHEYKRHSIFWRPVDTIELISIGIVSEEVSIENFRRGDSIHLPKNCSVVKGLVSRNYYAISKEFDLNEAWKNDWLRKNVLKHIFYDLLEMDGEIEPRNYITFDGNYKSPSKKQLRILLEKHGKTKEEIAEEIIDFVSNGYFDNTGLPLQEKLKYDLYDKFKPEFYAWYADYDWVVFCWLFGRMIDLPKGFPMYCRDLKQTVDEKERQICLENIATRGTDKACKNSDLRHYPDYPKKKNEHNALADAIWNKELYKFLMNL